MRISRKRRRRLREDQEEERRRSSKSRSKTGCWGRHRMGNEWDGNDEEGLGSRVDQSRVQERGPVQQTR
eukprot:9478426-Pyramimonas_sp.AAC.1